MWMDDVEMAIDAYRVWLETKIAAGQGVLSRMLLNPHDADVLVGEIKGWEQAPEAFHIIFKAGEEDAQ